MEVALKIVPKSRLTKHSQLEKMRKEIAIHESLNHANVVKFLSCFEDNINVYMVLELCHNGTLLCRIQNAPGLLPFLVCSIKQKVEEKTYFIFFHFFMASSRIFGYLSETRN